MTESATESTNYQTAYQQEVAFSRKAMQTVHNLTNENRALNAEIEALKAEIQRLNQSVTVNDIMDAFMKAVSDHNLSVIIRQNSEY